LPERLFDVHTHLWLPYFIRPTAEKNRGPQWPGLVARQNSVEDLEETYRLIFPRKQVTPFVFGSPRPGVVLDDTNGYITQVARQHRLPSLMISTPRWSAEELEQRVVQGGFLGLKPYYHFAPAHLKAGEITIFDFLPHHQLEVASRHGWIIMLHLPRPKRLGDPVNLQQMLEIEEQYPRVRLIIAHIGRAYCAEDEGNAFETLANTRNMLFDFSANTNAYIIERALRTFGAQRMLFGSDMPILRMRMRRICENGVYVNLVPTGLYGKVSDDPHMREVSPEEGERLTFFMYEELLAFRHAVEAIGLSKADVQDVMYTNAARVVAAAEASK
jgi:predicted TIM-barrel fold metal-dependent hydrolase